MMTEYLLSLEQVESLFEYVEAQLDETGCDHTRRHTKQWLAAHIPRNSMRRSWQNWKTWAATATAKF